MKAPLTWLREFVDVPGTAEEIARKMSVRGFAVEGIENDVIDFEVTANRPDCMSIVGLAREIATAFELPLKWDGGPPASAGAQDARTEVDIVLDDPDLCPRYVGAVADVTVRPSPEWMQDRLQACGIRPISNIVDITNYVLLELGQPMHAFDLLRIGRSRIRVRTARPGEVLKTLDSQSRTLTADMLVIADADQAIAVAGVMGGANSEVTNTTTAIVFESAYFNPASVRRTSKALGLKTEASMRFERGADPHMPAVAMQRALELLEQIGGGTRRGGILDRVRTPFGIEPRTLTLRRAKVSGLLGAAIPDADIERILASLGFSLVRMDPSSSVTASVWRVTVPTRRVDVTREVDLIEEIARHYGFDRLPSSFPALAAPPPAPDPRVQQTRGLRSLLTGAGFSEAVTFGFIAEAAARSFAGEDALVPIANPLSENFGVLRPSVLPGLIAAVAHNRRREQRDVRLFEIGARFLKNSGESRAIACAWTGAATHEHWAGGARDVDFPDIKGVAERLCQALRVVVATTPHDASWLMPGRAAAVRHESTTIGVFGQLTPTIADSHGLPATDAVYVLEIDLDAASRLADKTPISVEALPRYPSVTRDVSILVDAALAAERVRATARRAAPASLVRIREFDRYQGKGVPDGKISLSLHFTFRAADRTLTDAEVQSAMDDIVTALKHEHGAVQR
jgi:phenylalanyl-tRNA synthetase beta chain